MGVTNRRGTREIKKEAIHGSRELFEKLTLLLGALAVFGFVGGCKKQVASTPPTHAAPAPSAAQPTVTLIASPTRSIAATR